MSTEDETFILLVQKYKELYNMSDKNYSNQEVRDNFWTEISEIMQMTALECKEKWRKLRDCYRKAIKTRKMKSGAAAKKFRPWKYEQQMAFLLPHIEERTQVSSVPSPASHTTEEVDENADAEETDDVASQNSSMTDMSVSTAASQDPQPRRRKAKPKMLAAEVLSKYLEAKELKKMEKAQAKPHDSLGNVFLSIADTVRCLPLDLQISVKTDIFKTVTDAELVALQRSQAASSTSSAVSTFSNATCPSQSQNVIYPASYSTHPRELHSIYPAQSHFQEPQPSYLVQSRDAHSSYQIRHTAAAQSFRSSTQQNMYHTHQQFHQPSQISETQVSPLPLPSPQESVVSPNQPCLYPTEHTPESSEPTQ